MKFTNGYWLMRPQYEMTFATEYFRSKREGDTLSILAPGKPIANRGDMLNIGAITVELSAPMENVIRVKLTHHAGTQPKTPDFSIHTEAGNVHIEEDADSVSFGSGALTAKVCKASRNWGISFEADGQVLTESGYHGMAHAHDKQTGRNYMIDSLMLDVGELVYGLGERFSAYVKNGQSVDIWNEDGGTASEQTYKNIPFYMTNRGYGIFVDNPGDVSFEVASEKVERVQFSVEGEELVYYILYGPTPKDVLRRYTALTGRPALPPAWSFGLWLTTSFTTSYDEQTVTRMLDGMAKYNIPLRVFHFDCFWMKGFNWCDFDWDPEAFPDPKGFMQRLHDRGLNICLWINPYIAQESPLFREGKEKGYLLRKENGDVWQTDLWQPGMAILDVTNPEACRWYQGMLRSLLEMGVDCFKTDFGERIPVTGIRYFDGSDPVRMHNYYTFLYNQMVFSLLEEVRGKGEAMLYARSATAGSQQFPVHWGGDNSAAYISMAETLRGGLSLSHSGFGFWSHDISGFEQTAPADVYKRWCAFGLLSSHSRLHGSSSYRVPWLFDEESCVVLQEFVQLKMRLMPYLYGAAAEAHREGVPMLRPMILEFPEDMGAGYCDTQYMLGGSLLVAPVMRKDGHVRYYLPEGRWTNLFTGEVLQGGGYREEIHDFHSLPLLVRENAAIPMGACETKPDYDYTDGLNIHIYEPADGAREVHIPDLNGECAAVYHITIANGTVTASTTGSKAFTVTLHRNGAEETFSF